MPTNLWFSTVKSSFLLVGNTDPRRSGFARLVDLTRHYKQDYKPAMKQSMLPKCSDKGACPATSQFTKTAASLTETPIVTLCDPRHSAMA